MSALPTGTLPADPAPADLDVALSPGWLSAALSSTTGASVEVVEVDEVWRLENMATKVRFGVTYAGTPTEGLGNAFCIKGVFGQSRLPGMSSRVTGAETRFYREIASELGVRVPDAVYTGIDPGTGRGVLLMKDVVAAGGRFLTALEPYSPAQARDSLSQLARLHATSWGATGPARQPWLGNRLDELAETPLIPTGDLQILLDGERGLRLPDGIRDAELLHRGLRATAAATKTTVPCLVHGDAHAGNIYLLDGTSIIDWQLVQVNSWALDVAYHLGSVLTVEDRRTHEKELVRCYLENLRELGVDAPAENDAWTAYRTHMIYGYYLWAATRFVDPVITVEFVTRLGTAVADLDSFEAVGA